MGFFSSVVPSLMLNIVTFFVVDFFPVLPYLLHQKLASKGNMAAPLSSHRPLLSLRRELVPFACRFVEKRN